MPRRGSHMHVWSLRGRLPGLAWALVSMLLLALAGDLGLRLAAPTVHWRLDAATDRLRVWLSPGASPLAGYVFSRTSWTAVDETEPAAKALTLQLRPGEIFSAQVAVLGPDPSRTQIIALVPVTPQIESEDLEGPSLVLHSSQPLTSVAGAPAGSWRPADPSVVTLQRQTAETAYRLEVVGQGGGRGVWNVEVPALPEVPVIWFGSAQNGQVYVTIDDGWYPSAYLLRLMQTTHLPVTAFLIARAAAENPEYWRAFVAAGGLIEDHTASHPNLTRLTLDEAEAQWQTPLGEYSAWFGVPMPSFGRPPYGALDSQVRAAAWVAGLKAIVMWDVVWEPGTGFKTWNSGPIRAGDIVLLHWVPGVGHAVAKLLKTLQRHGLHPALLTSGVL